MEKTETDVLFVRPGEGRIYALGRMNAVFKADHGETGNAYSVSEWWLEPRTSGPGAHSHEENVELFYVLSGVASILTGEDWLEAPAGSFVRIPATVMHDFENRTEERVGLLNVFLPGGFEENMPSIVKWFADNP
ncbi:cupin domain-containing protein [Shinella curvata]|uniref:Cupin domain-containing protein n=1 Tax=Shinella curvata TaxID=1817964 RepID=A0ABT8X9B1_9HYPH|nr:cupin domain-containing protein [Shinella curvata]MCJ8051825.1 cupin domain-containing protein [Shinella curvata]MDO6120227.1 cupin domain-containing protein [Shinella curvata]